MKRLKRDAIILSLAESLNKKGSWCGETHIQKSTYFLQELLEVPLSLEYILYKHGPYSFDLSSELNAMRADEFLKLESQPFPYGPSLIPADGGEFLKTKFQKTLRKYRRQVQFIADKLGDKNVVELERLSTALYATRRTDDTDINRRASYVNSQKHHISIDEARTAIGEVDALISESEDFKAEA